MFVQDDVIFKCGFLLLKSGVHTELQHALLLPRAAVGRRRLFERTGSEETEANNGNRALAFCC